MTLDALFASVATQAPTEGSLIPLEEMPLGAFKEMVERHLGRELTDDTGRDLAAWLESTVPAGDATPGASAAMAHLLVGMARGEAGEPLESSATPVDTDPAPATTTLGERLSALARSIGLPIGRRDDNAPAAPATDEPQVVDSAQHGGSDEAAQQIAARRPVMRPPLSKAQRQAVIAAASPATTPLVIDLRGEDPFELAALGGGKPSPTGVVPQASALAGLHADATASTGTGGAEPSSMVVPPPTEAATGLAAFATAGDDAVATPPASNGAPLLDTPEPTAHAAVREDRVAESTPPRSSTSEPSMRIDLSQIASTRGNVADAQPGVRAQATPPPAPSVVPPMAVERIMRIVELQATAPPPRMAVVEIPELEGLRIMVSITDRGAVSVTPLGGLTETVQAPFMQSVTTALETQGFLLDERSRGRSEEHRQNSERGRPDRDQPRRRPRPDGLFA